MTYRIVETSERLEMRIVSREDARLSLLCDLNEEGQRQGRIQQRLSEALRTPERYFTRIQARASSV